MKRQRESDILDRPSALGILSAGLSFHGSGSGRCVYIGFLNSGDGNYDIVFASNTTGDELTLSHLQVKNSPLHTSPVLFPFHLFGYFPPITAGDQRDCREILSNQQTEC